MALENFLENVLANEVTISKEAVTLAEKAFSDAPNDYDFEHFRPIFRNRFVAG